MEKVLELVHGMEEAVEMKEKSEEPVADMRMLDTVERMEDVVMVTMVTVEKKLEES